MTVPNAWGGLPVADSVIKVTDRAVADIATADMYALILVFMKSYCNVYVLSDYSSGDTDVVVREDLITLMSPLR